MHNQGKEVVIVEWLATGLLIVGTVLTSWNIYPLNILVAITSGMMWIWVSWQWRKWSLILLNCVLLTIYISGLIGLLLK
jgi:hypothetical protein